MPDFVAVQASSPWVCFKFRENLVYFSSVPSHQPHFHWFIHFTGHASNLPQNDETGPGRHEVTAITSFYRLLSSSSSSVRRKSSVRWVKESRSEEVKKWCECDWLIDENGRVEGWTWVADEWDSELGVAKKVKSERLCFVRSRSAYLLSVSRRWVDILGMVDVNWLF